MPTVGTFVILQPGPRYCERAHAEKLAAKERVHTERFAADNAYMVEELRLKHTAKEHALAEKLAVAS